MYFFNEPAEPFTVFTYYDLTFLFIIIAINIYILKKKQNIKLNRLIKASVLTLFFILIPYLSNTIETKNIYKKFTIVDSFNLWYLLFKYPVWWIIGTLEVLFLFKFQKKSQSNF